MSFEDLELKDIRTVGKVELLSGVSIGPMTWEIHPSIQIEPTQGIQASALVIGERPPEWTLQPMSYQALRLHACRFDNAFFFPEWGVIFPKPGKYFNESTHAARYKSPDLSQIPGFIEGDNSPVFNISNNDLNHYSGTYLVLNHWGSKNFGHFIFDSLPAVMIFLSEIVKGELKLITPLLKDWQWSFLIRMGIPKTSVLEVESESCRCERIIYPSSLQDNLNFPSPLTKMMLEYLRVSGEGQLPAEAKTRIYLTRRNFDSREMSNEGDLINALAPLGFVEVCPEDYSVDQQIDIFSGAEIIVGEIGAAFSNAAFSIRKCSIVEIIPEIKPSIWIKNLCALMGFHWSCIYTTVPIERRTISVVDGIEYDNLVFSYDVCVDDVIKAVKSAVEV